MKTVTSNTDLTSKLNLSLLESLTTPELYCWDSPAIAIYIIARSENEAMSFIKSKYAKSCLIAPNDILTLPAPLRIASIVPPNLSNSHLILGVIADEIKSY